MEKQQLIRHLKENQNSKSVVSINTVPKNIENLVVEAKNVQINER